MSDNFERTPGTKLFWYTKIKLSISKVCTCITTL